MSGVEKKRKESGPICLNEIKECKMYSPQQINPRHHPFFRVATTLGGIETSVES